MEKGYKKKYAPTEPLEISFRLEESEVMKFKLLMLKRVMERMKDEFKQEFYSLKYSFHSIKVEILSELRILHTIIHLLKKKIRRPRILSPHHI